MYGLDLSQLPEYRNSSFKYFADGEKHVTRICPDDVLIMMYDGDLYFNENNIPVKLSRGDYYIQKRGLFQQGLIPSSTARYYYIHFCGEYCDNGDTLPLRGTADYASFFPMFEKMNSMQLLKASYLEKCAVFYNILSLLKSKAPDTIGRRIVSKVTTHIANDYSRIYSLDELADLCGYSKNNLIKIFRTETGKTPFEYIAELRIDSAKRMLENSDMTFQAISEACGFGSYVNMYKNFIKVEACTPGEWRKRKLNL